MSRLIKHSLLLLLSVLLAIPVVGFIGGMLCCEDCGSNVFAYLLMGLIHAFITILAGGHLWLRHDELTNAWPYILPTGVALYVCFLGFRQLRHQNAPKGE